MRLKLESRQRFIKQPNYSDGKLSASKNKRTAGFSLIELLVTMLLVAITVLGLMRLQSTLVHAAVDNAQRSIGIFLGSEILDRIRANASGIEAYDQALAAPNCNSAPAVCGSSSSCSASKVAERDVWEVMCTGAANGVSNLAMNLECTDDSCAMSTSAILRITWQEKSTGESSSSEGEMLLSTVL